MLLLKGCGFQAFKISCPYIVLGCNGSIAQPVSHPTGRLRWQRSSAKAAKQAEERGYVVAVDRGSSVPPRKASSSVYEGWIEKTLGPRYQRSRQNNYPGIRG